MGRKGHPFIYTAKNGQVATSLLISCNNLLQADTGCVDEKSVAS